MQNRGPRRCRSYSDAFEPRPAQPALPRRAGIAPKVSSALAFRSNPTVRTRDIKLKGDDLAFRGGWCQKIPSVRSLPGTRLRAFPKADCSLQHGAASHAPREVRQRQLALESAPGGGSCYSARNVRPAHLASHVAHAANVASKCQQTTSREWRTVGRCATVAVIMPRARRAR